VEITAFLPDLTEVVGFGAGLVAVGFSAVACAITKEV
jgi:hypothetical protein